MNATSNNTRSTLIIAGAVVFAGLLIAAGIVFGNQSNNTDTADNADDTQTATAEEINIEPVSEDDWLRGQTDAQVTIVEYSDPECPYCKRFHDTMNQVVDNYDGSQVAWAYRHFPISQLHSKAPQEAQALECAGQIGGQEAFWQFADTLYAETPSNDGLDLSRLPEFAETAGVDVTAFEECTNSDQYQDLVQSEYQDATSNGGQGTPYNVVVTNRGNTYPLPGAVPYQSMTQVVDAILEGIEQDLNANEVQSNINQIIGA